MIIHYLPSEAIIIDGVMIKFNESRESVRSKLLGTYKEENQTIQMGASTIEVLHQRRDIYKNFNNTINFFFLGYDEHDFLNEIEVHQCDKITVLDISIYFNDDLNHIALQLETKSPISRKGEGEYFFKDLKISIMDKSQMGGEGNSLGYFYCASDVSHLE